jgi:uncharacterized protein YndB with AHSA1/START domain
VDDTEVSKYVTVPVAPDQAFRIFTEHPAEWLPPGHTFLPEPQLIASEPRVGGRYYERDAAGAEISRGTVTEWAPPHRLAVTWRIGANWQPVFDDDHASVIEVDFRADGYGSTDVVLTYTQLHRHGEWAESVRAALNIDGPGETLLNYADAVARRLPR